MGYATCPRGASAAGLYQCEVGPLCPAWQPVKLGYTASVFAGGAGWASANMVSAAE